MKKDKIYNMSERNGLLKYYDNQSPSRIKVEDIDDNYYPLDIPEPDIAYIPPAEPHILITDLYEKKDDWYILSELIDDFACESYASYNNGLYYASFMLSTTCLELTLKYELVRQKKILPQKLKESNYSFGNVQKDLKRRRFKNIKMRDYRKNIGIIGDVRNGMFHFNPDKLKKSLELIDKDLFGSFKNSTAIGIAISSDEKKNVDFNDISFDPLDEFLNHFEWNKVAFFTYSTLHRITKDLYGDDKKIQYFREGIDDYLKLKSKNKQKQGSIMAALENKRLQYFLDMIKKYEQKKKKKPTIRTPTHSKDDSATKKQLKTRKNSNSERTLIGSF
jgi:hypothetical protein